jgi:hypothetical protein
MGQRLLIAIAFVLQGICVFAQVAIRTTNQEKATAIDALPLRHSNPMFVINAGDKTLQIPPAMESRHSFSMDMNDIKDMNDINPRWIQSITVIKEQEAIDKYGASGRYGVVIIELMDNAFDKMPAHLAERFKIK